MEKGAETKQEKAQLGDHTSRKAEFVFLTAGKWNSEPSDHYGHATKRTRARREVARECVRKRGVAG